MIALGFIFTLIVILKLQFREIQKRLLEKKEKDLHEKTFTLEQEITEEKVKTEEYEKKINLQKKQISSLQRESYDVKLEMAIKIATETIRLERKFLQKKIQKEINRSFVSDFEQYVKNNF